MLLAWLLLPGCAELHRKAVQFDQTCSEDTLDKLSARQDDFGPLTGTRTLECALSALRGSQDAALRRTALGSRLSLLLAERNPDPGQREKLAAEGVRFAEAALALGADGDGPVHYYLATNLGLAVRNHMTLAVENLPRLESELQRAVALSPDIDGGGPLRVLGALYLKAPPWPAGIGDADKAFELLKRAVDSHPEHPLNHLFYAQTLWETEEDAAIEQAKSEMANGKKLLKQGRWKFNRASWNKEFAEFQQEIGVSRR